MKKNDILGLIKDVKKINLYSLGDQESLKKIIFFVKNFEDTYSNYLDEIDNSNVRYSDYYSHSLHGEEIINCFNMYYSRDDIDKQVRLYLIYVIFKNLKEIVEAFEILELEEILDYIGQSISDLSFLIDEFERLIQLNQENVFEFEKNKYKIFFTGYSYEDIISHEKFVANALINKLNNSLSVDDTVRGAEGVGHVRDKFDVPMLRVHLADDYRITFLRNGDITIILGIELKTGKNINYTRYDSIARRIDDFYDEASLFLSDSLPENSVHYRTMKYLNDFKRKQEKKKIA